MRACTKPDATEFWQLAQYTFYGFAAIGAVVRGRRVRSGRGAADAHTAPQAWVIKTAFIPINNIIMSRSLGA